eukprot:3163920-Ditylum_brightwellii.AAC.1
MGGNDENSKTELSGSILLLKTEAKNKNGLDCSSNDEFIGIGDRESETCRKDIFLPRSFNHAGEEDLIVGFPESS